MTAESFVQAHLRNLPLLQRATPAELALIVPLVETFRLYPNEYVFRQGQPSRGMYVLVEGRAVLTRTEANGVESVVAEMGAHQYVGDAALFTAGTEMLSLRVVETALVLFLARDRFAALLAQHPELTLNINVPAAVKQSGGAKVFPDQRPGEQVVRMVRRHWWAIVARSVLPGLLAVFLLILGLLLLGTVLGVLIWGATALLLVASVIFLYLDWRNDFVIVTDQRIVFVEEMLMRFQTHVRDTPLKSVQEVNFEIPTDPFARLFNYGRINISTAGSGGRVVIDYLPDPRELQRIIFATRQTRTEVARQQNRNVIDARLDQALGTGTGDGSAPPAVAGGLADPPTAAQKPPRSPAAGASRPRGWLATRLTGPNGESIYRKHLSIWALKVIWPLLAIVGAFVLMLMSLLVLGRGALGLIELAAGALLIVVGGVWFYLADWDWRNDYYIVGSDTISIIRQRPLWLRDEKDQMLITQIDNVISKKVGIVDSLLNRGDVRIMLVGDDRGEGRVFRHVYGPERIQAEISQRRAEALERTRSREAEQQQQTILDYLAAYDARARASQSAGAQPTTPVQPPPIQQPPHQSPPTTLPGVQGGSRPPGVPRARGQQ